ncbi:MAG: glycine cleavage system aminomethyltransferase GcvT [Candidatus Aminicenantes bacterium]|nr:glycine cleavage system aminomethyltransferase GcvT [Candidatus Aminicenantes bacterium]
MKKTRLHESHKKLNSRMIEFFGWEMPVEYSGIIAEHLAVREAAGLFDVSHMGEFLIRGKDALALVQHLTPNDAARLAPYQAQYSALTTPQGTFVDDLLVYCLGPEEYFLVPNAANTDKDYAWIVAHKDGFDAVVENVSERYTQIALQGPKAREILQSLTDVDLPAIKRFWARPGKVAGVDSLISRTGYTGEDGFEIYMTASEPAVVWEEIIRTGRPHGLLPVGLGARDTLRLEASLMLYGNDIDETTTVLEADLKWIVKFKKGDFLGREALEKQAAEGIKRKIVGFELREKGIPRSHYPVFVRGQKAGEVTSGTFSPYLKKSIGLVYLPVADAEIGAELEVGIRDKKIAGAVVPIPFYRRETAP